MTEPASGTIGVITALGLISIAPWVDTNALMGSCLGAGLVAYNKTDIPPFKRLGALVFSATLGYLMADEVVSLTVISETSAGGFVGAIAIVPLAMKLISTLDTIDFNDVLNKWRGTK